MRLKGQDKLRYFPAPPEALADLASFVTPAAGAVLLDPCCGQGGAVKTLADALGVPPQATYACELDIERGAAASKLLKDAQVLAPCDYLTAIVSKSWASVVWCNPPYDAEAGGGREIHEKFLKRAGDALVPGGLLMLCLPADVLASRPVLREELVATYRDLLVVTFPKEHRRFNEVCLFGIRYEQRITDPRKLHKKMWEEGKPLSVQSFERVVQNGLPVYTLPPGLQPKSFAKGSLTRAEVAFAMHASPVKGLFAAPKPKAQPKPGLQLGVGQRALVLAGGYLNCVLDKGDGPVLIKANPIKEQFVKSTNEEEVPVRGGGYEVRTTTIHSERICLRIRVLDADGTIHDLR